MHDGLPERRELRFIDLGLQRQRWDPTLAAWAGKLYLIGGFSPGSLDEFLFDPEFFPKCPEAIMADAERAPWLPVAGDGSNEGGCRAIRALDLTTGTWSVPEKLAKARWEMGSAQLGSQLFLVGGAQASAAPLDKQVIYRFDLSIPKLFAPAVKVPAELLAGSPVPWSDGILIVFDSKAYYYDPAQQIVQLDALGFPCKVGSAPLVFRFPVPENNLFILKIESESGVCSPNYFEGPGAPYAHAFLRYHGGKWDWTPTFNSPTSEVVPVVADDAVYLLQGGASQSGEIPPVLRLSSIDGNWEELPPMPFFRNHFAAVAVEQ